MRHWFDGLAMLHRFTIDGGRVSYGNRYLESRAYRAAREQGRIAYGEFATDPCRSLFKRVQTLFAPGSAISDNANVNVMKLGERFIAMTETPLPVQFDARTLETAEVAPYVAPGVLTTAHPHLDRAGGGMINYAAKLGPRSSYRFFGLDPDDTKPRVLASVPVKEPAYMHSFGLTERWIVLAEFPFVVNPLSLALVRPALHRELPLEARARHALHADRPQQQGAPRRRSPARPASPSTTSTRTSDGDEVVVDLCAYEDPAIVEDLYLERLRAGKPVHGADAHALRPRRPRRHGRAAHAGRGGPRAATDRLRAPQRAPLPLRLGQRHRPRRLARTDRRRWMSSPATR